MKLKLYKGILPLVALYLIYLGYEVVSVSISEKEGEVLLENQEQFVEEDTVIEQMPVVEEIVEEIPQPEPKIEEEKDTIIAETVVIEEPEKEIEEEPVEEVKEYRVSIKEISICRMVTREREPVEVSQEFPNDVGVLYCFSIIENLGDSTTVSHIWYYEGRRMAKVDMEVGRSYFWRLWSRKTIIPGWIGSWRVAVLDSDGEEIGSTNFKIVRKSDDMELESGVIE